MFCAYLSGAICLLTLLGRMTGEGAIASPPRHELGVVLNDAVFIKDCIGIEGGTVLIGLDPTYATEGDGIVESLSTRLLEMGAAETVIRYAPSDWNSALKCEGLPPGPRATVFIQMFKDTSGDLQAALVRVWRDDTCREVSLELGKYPSRCRLVNGRQGLLLPWSRDEQRVIDTLAVHLPRGITQSKLPRAPIETRSGRAEVRRGSRAALGVSVASTVVSALGLALSASLGKRSHARIKQPSWATPADNGRSVCDLQPVPEGCMDLERARGGAIASAIGLGVSAVTAAVFTGILIRKHGKSHSLLLAPGRGKIVAGIELAF